MKHVDFVRHLTGHGCVLHRQGARHEIYLNPANGNRTAVPRHREIKETTARRICDQRTCLAPHLALGAVEEQSLW